MSTRILVLKDGVITPSRSDNDITTINTSLGITASLALKANLISPALTGTPTAPTATAGTNTTQIANTTFVSTAISNLVASSPAALDTLNELAAALGNDANFSTTVTNALASRVDVTTNQTIGGIKTFSDGFALPTNIGTTIGTVWRNVDNLEYKDSTNITRITLNSAGNLSNLNNRQTALNNLVGTQTTNRLLRSDGINTTLSQVNLNSDITGSLPIVNGSNFYPNRGYLNANPDNYLFGVEGADFNLGDGLKGWHFYSSFRLNSPGFGTQLAIADTDSLGAGKIRCKISDSWQPWNTLITSSGNQIFRSTTQSTSTTTGGVVFGGGVGVNGNGHFTGVLQSNGRGVFPVQNIHTAISPNNHVTGIHSGDVNIDVSTKGWHFITSLRPDNVAYGIQLALCDTQIGVKYRNLTNGIWQAWNTIL